LNRLAEDLANRKLESAAIRSRIHDLEAEIQDLEAAGRIFRRYAATPRELKVPRLLQETMPVVPGAEDVGDFVGTLTGRPISGDLAGKTIREAARLILAEVESGEYGEIARMALARGYRSHKSGDDAEKITRSFYETMRRNPADFDQSGPSFRLRTPRAEDAENYRPEPDDASPNMDDISSDFIDCEEPTERQSAKSSPATTTQSFNDAPEPARDYAATIAWGDGTTSAARVVARGDGFVEVGGTHLYQSAGAYPLSVVIRSPAGP